ncbi:Proteophosphoglycan ppg4 [Pyrrhoderma noxium]|uniref:Proteophosphoglycan ppg4 n=1 Tax=Pyrrhoderma noxium TaxID=2282107 RepID=A0A286UT84_9AGAM|nr:Proteophosphoglycan ppg4 [Pyrrhoderma noxium]
MSNTTSEVVLTRCIVESPDSTVYEATLDGKIVVIKFAFTKNRRDLLKREAGLYVNKLHKLQGTVIPIFYGFYYGRLKESVGWLETRRVNCIVLEHCGEHIPRIGCLSFEQRLEIFDLMAEVHQNGYHHFDLNKGNICFKDGKFRLIDLEDVRRHEDRCGRRTTCTWKGDSRKIKLGGNFPFDDLSCDNLLLTGTDMRLWYSSEEIEELDVRGALIDEDLDQLPSQVNVDKLLPGGCELNDDHFEEAIEWLKNVKKEIDMCSDEKDIEELIKRRASELPKDYVDQVLP